jgi:hypothetical protein
VSGDPRAQRCRRPRRLECPRGRRRLHSPLRTCRRSGIEPGFEDGEQGQLCISKGERSVIECGWTRRSGAFRFRSEDEKGGEKRKGEKEGARVRGEKGGQLVERCDREDGRGQERRKKETGG